MSAVELLSCSSLGGTWVVPWWPGVSGIVTWHGSEILGTCSLLSILWDCRSLWFIMRTNTVRLEICITFRQRVQRCKRVAAGCDESPHSEGLVMMSGLTNSSRCFFTIIISIIILTINMNSDPSKHFPYTAGAQRFKDPATADCPPVVPLIFLSDIMSVTPRPVSSYPAVLCECEAQNNRKMPKEGQLCLPLPERFNTDI